MQNFWIPILKHPSKQNKNLNFLLFFYKIFLLTAFFMPVKFVFMGIFYVAILPYTLHYIFISSYGKRFLRSSSKNLLFQLIMLLFLYCFAYSLIISNNFKILLRIFSTIVFFLATLIFCKHEKKPLTFFNTLALIALISAIISCALHYFTEGGFLVNTLNRLYPIGQLHNPINGVAAYSLMAIICLHLLLTPKLPLKPLYITSFLCFLFLIIASMSRTPLLSLILGCSVIVLGNFFQHSKKHLFITLIILAIMSVAALYALSFERVFEVLMDRGISFRDVIWQDAIGRIIANPLGYGTWNHENLFANLTFHPHNMFLAIAYYYGIAGLLIFTLIIALITINTFHKKNILGIAILCFIVSTIFFDTHIPFRSPSDLWLIFWLPLVGLMAQQNKSISLKAL